MEEKRLCCKNLKVINGIVAKLGLHCFLFCSGGEIAADTLLSVLVAVGTEESEPVFYRNKGYVTASVRQQMNQQLPAENSG